MSYLIKQKLNEIMDMVEETSYGKISSYALERLKNKCMGDDLYRVSFEYTIEWIGRVHCRQRITRRVGIYQHSSR